MSHRASPPPASPVGGSAPVRRVCPGLAPHPCEVAPAATRGVRGPRVPFRFAARCGHGCPPIPAPRVVATGSAALAMSTAASMCRSATVPMPRGSTRGHADRVVLDARRARLTGRLAMADPHEGAHVSGGLGLRHGASRVPVRRPRGLRSTARIRAHDRGRNGSQIRFTTGPSPVRREWNRAGQAPGAPSGFWGVTRMAPMVRYATGPAHRCRSLLLTERSRVSGASVPPPQGGGCVSHMS